MAGNPDQEIARLRSELEAAEAERMRLRSELEQIRRSPLGPLIDPARTIRAALDRRLRRFRRRRSGSDARGESAESRRLPPRLSGSELAWLARRRLRPGRGGVPTATAPPREGWLTPILVDCFGRDGSTALMAILAASPGIVVDPKYPYERRYFTYIWRWSRLPARTEWPGALWSKDDVVSIAQEDDLTLLGPPPWLPRELLDSGGDGAEFARRSFDLAWGELSAHAIDGVASAGGAAPRYYAEKHANTWMVDLEQLPALTVIALLRDPRDVHASILAFEDKEPATSFGILDARAGGDRLEGIIDRHRQRLRWIADLLDSGAAPVVRYEDLARDPGMVARALASELEVEIEPGDLELDALASRHGSSSGDGSGRWRTDLDPAIAERFNRELGPELRALGFET